MKNITYLMLLIIILSISGCAEQEQVSKEGVECDASKPCDEGYECVKLPDKANPMCITKDTLQSTKYKDCIMLESYPVQLKCPSKTKGGCEADSDCKISGCNGEVCAEQEMTSICLYKPEFECYSLINCKCLNGECGWEKTEEFSACLAGKITP